MPGTPPGTSGGLGSLQTGNPSLARAMGPAKEKTVISSPSLCWSPGEAGSPEQVGQLEGELV